MDRRRFLKRCALTAAAMSSAGNAVGGGLSFANKTANVNIGKRRPNVIYILADDLGYGDPGCYAQARIKTPNLDKLAAEGMKFTDHYAGTTVCAPARCVLMTGLHTGHCYVRGNRGVDGYDLPLPDGKYTVAEMFRQSGYATGCCGKWGLGGPGTSGHPNNQGFDHFFGYLGQAKAHYYYPAFLWRNSDQVTLNGTEYSHDLIAQEALGFINDNKDRPFFLYMPFTIPHAELKVPDDEIIRDYQAIGWPETPYPPGQHYGEQETPHAAFAAMISRMDRDIGRVMSLMKQLGLDEDTVIMFSSDNGPHSEGGADPVFFDSNGPFRGIKRDLYEGGIRVPFIVRWPGMVKPGTTSSHISAFWDFMPTCAELIGITPPPGLDGISFLPELLGRRQRAHEYMYWEFHEQGGKQAVRMGNWKGICLNRQNDADPPVQLYNLGTDPGEQNNIAEENPQVAQQMKNIMSQAHTESEIFKFFEES